MNVIKCDVMKKDGLTCGEICCALLYVWLSVRMYNCTVKHLCMYCNVVYLIVA